MSKKASNIAELQRHGIAVPAGFQLDQSHYQEAIQPVLPALMEAATEALAAERVFAALPLPPRTVQALRDGLQAIPESSALAVRSSGCVFANGNAIAEDSGGVSLAGQFESFLNVPRDKLHDAVRLCWASLFNARSIEVFGVDGDYVSKSAMTVLVQAMVPAVASAVVMTVDPLGDGTTGGIELALGPCEAIVGGSVSPDEVTFDRATGQIIERHVGSKEFAVDYLPFARGRDNAVRRPVPDNLRAQLAVTDSVLTRIIDLAGRIEGIFRAPQDIEIVVERDGTITVVQSRAITSLPDTFSPLNSASV